MDFPMCAMNMEPLVMETARDDSGMESSATRIVLRSSRRIVLMVHMETRQSNKYKMYLAVKKVVDEKTALWQTFPAFISDYNRWKARISSIKTLGEQQDSATGGIAENKTTARKTMSDAAFEIASAIHVYAINQADKELAEKVKFSVTDLLAGKDTESSKRCTGIYTIAQASLAAIADYGVTAEKVDNLNILIGAYDGLLVGPQTAKAKIKTITAQLATEFDKADELLNDHLDKLMVQFKTSQPAFYSDYANARNIIDSGGGHASPPPTPPAPPQ